MAVDVAAPAAESALATPFARLAAIPARVVLGAIVAVSSAVRLAAALAHATPLYFPDEYIYATLARSLAEDGRPLIRGVSASFPALLEPILAAPFWLAGDPMLAYRLTQGLNALAMSLAAIPVYLLCRRLGLRPAFSLGASAIAVASPNLLYASFVLADPIAYPLVLGALCSGVYALARPTRRSQLAFVALAGLATFARVQYVILPVAFILAAVVLERRRVVRAHALPLALFAAPVVVALALGPGRLLGYYSGVTSLDVEAGEVVHWAGVDAMMLAYSAGWVLVPGALIGLVLAFARPRVPAERAFALLALLFAAGVFLEASLYAASGSTRYQERYLMTLVPLFAPAFGLFVARAHPRRLVLLPLAAGLLLLSVLVPLSGFTAAENKQDSPLLFAIFRLESAIGTADGALAVAVAAALLSGLAVAIASSRRGAALALAVTVAFGAVTSAAAFDFDARNARNVRQAHLPPDLRWIDRSGLRDVVLVQTPGAPKGRALEQLFWNTSVTRVVVLKGAHPTDAFGADPLRVADDGRLLVDERALDAPLLVENYGVRAELTGAVRVTEGASFELWRPRDTPRFSLLVSGAYSDSWLARTGSITVWPDATGHARGTLTLRLSLPTGTERTPMRFQAPGVDRVVRVSPGGQESVTFRFSTRSLWRVVWRTPKNGFLADGRAISVRAERPELTRTYATYTQIVVGRSLARALGEVLACAPLVAAGPGLAQQPRVQHLVDDYAGSVSPDGRTIVFERFFSTLRYGVDTHPVEKRAVLLLMRVDGSRKRVLRHPGATFEYDATFSPDGRSILFVRDDRIHVMRRDGSGTRPVRRDVLEHTCPRFSPDGRKISFWRGRRAKSGGYFVMNADGTGLRRIVGIGREAPWGCPSWFPDGRRLAFAKDYKLHVASGDGTRVRRLPAKRHDTLYRPSVSPDGRWIACDGYLDGSGYGVIVMRADGTEIRRITTALDEINSDSGAAWSPDSRRILFSGSRRGFKGAGVYVVNRDGSGLRRLSNFAR